MAITYRASGSLSRGTGNVYPGVPANCAEGDLLILLLVGRDAVPALPDGWTSIGTSSNSTNIHNRTCYKIATSSESAVTVTDSGAYTVAQMFLFTGVDSADPIDASGTNTSDGTAFSATGITTTVDNAMVIHAIAFQDSGTTTDYVNFASVTNANLTSLGAPVDSYFYSASNVNGGCCLVTGFKTAAGATGNTTATADSADNYSAVVTFSLTPSSAPEVTYVGKGAQARGTGDISVAVPTGYAAGDLLVLVLSGRDAVPALPDGWTNIATANNSTYTYNRTCYKIATSSESAVTVADSGVYTTGVMLLFSGNDTANPINVSGTSTVDGTSFVAAGVTTTVDKCLVVHATSFTDSATTNDSTNYSTPSNANLLGLAERNDYVYYGGSAGIEAGIHVVIGFKNPAGATGDTSATADSADNYSATVTFAISPPVEAGIPEGGSSASVIITAQGGGLTIRQGGASVSAVVAVQGSGISIRQGSASQSVIVSAQGGGLKIVSGSSDSQAIISAQAGGTKTGQGSAESSVIVSAQGNGNKTASSGAESSISITVQGNGIKTGSGSSDSSIIISPEGAGIVVSGDGADVTVIVSTQGAGTKLTSGGADSPIVIAAQAGGLKLSQGGSDSSVTVSADGAGVIVVNVEGGADSTVNVETQGTGIKIVSGGSSSPVVVPVDSDGYKQAQSGSEPSVIISTQGGGYGIGLIKSGGSETIVIVSSDGDGSKIASGSSESTVIVTVEGFGTDYSPAIMTAVFSGAVITAIFNSSSELTAAFNFEAEQTAVFSQAELTAAFVPSVEMGGSYGKG